MKSKIAPTGCDTAYTIVLDYNGRGKVATKNFYDVTFNTKEVNNDFRNALALSGGTVPDELQRIPVKFDVRNGGHGLYESTGIILSHDDSYLVYNSGAFANDFTITIDVPASYEYLNIRWHSDDGSAYDATYVKAKIKPVDCSIVLDFNGRGKVATSKNLYDVQVDIIDYANFLTPPCT